jgi:lysophospholipase
VEKYFESVGELLTRGFAVVTFDWRGQGSSDRALPDRHLGHVRHFSDFRLDYEAVRATIAEGESVTVLAHSMGGAIALAGSAEGWLGAERLACINPMIGLSMVRAQPFAKRLARVLAWAGFAGRIVPGGVTASISTQPFDRNLLSTDPVRYDRNAALARALEWGAIGSPTIGWLAAAYEAMDRLSRPGVALAVSLPVLFVLSERDPVCSTPAMAAFGRALPDARVVTIPDARHEILMETDAILARFWEAFDAFVASSTPSEPGSRPKTSSS